MNLRIFTIICCLACSSCIGLRGSSKRSVGATVVEPVKEYTYVVKSSYPHQTDSYTQGLIYRDGALIEGTGLNGESRIMEVDIASGKTRQIAELDATHFGEGITILRDTLYQLTWSTNRLFVYDAKSEKLLHEKIYAGEGWGITTDGESLYTSDGTSVIAVREPSSFKVKRRISVALNGQSINYLNELEWIDGKIWANVYTLDQIVIINPESGAVEGVVDLTAILPEAERTPKTDVLNGIAYDSVGKRIFVTGKNWSRLFEIEIVEK